MLYGDHGRGQDEDRNRDRVLAGRDRGSRESREL